MTPQSRAEAPPWLSLPAEVSDLLRPRVDEIVDHIIKAVPRDVPDYARPMEGRFGQGLHQGVAIALDRFLDLPGSDRPALEPDSRRVYAGLGRGEFRSGRQLGSLLAAYRSGARVTFRTAAQIAVQAGVAPDVIVPLGESIFAYIDELSAASVEGYADEQNEQLGEVERRRTELALLILHGRASSAGIDQAALAAGWALPPMLAVVALRREQAQGLRLALGRGALVVEREDDVVALVPAPTTERARRDLERALRGRGAVVGPTRPWNEAPESLRLTMLTIARLEQAATRSAVAPERPDIVFVGDYLAQLALHAEPAVVADLARVRLAPLDAFAPATRGRLAETLLHWLVHWGQRQPVADALSIHPQTVGYRVTQLREAFGPALDDPEIRFELLLVLRAGHR
ncbi:CdaR family transcriptional regulator [uncultured Arsenicicoccus sp.]|uniref:PucR family transcriptional regulator n=1 Tax=uncultured Arsenicicoccus sp. TaxID=491339 RepID=UPI002592AFB4|nr:helix-turn-helix domain-containing protein [uncultured Arsenicicoccus sp.]